VEPAAPRSDSNSRFIVAMSFALQAQGCGCVGSVQDVTVAVVLMIAPLAALSDRSFVLSFQLVPKMHQHDFDY